MAAVLWTPLAAVIALGIAQPINSAVAERRPFVVIRNSLTLVHHSADYGFPSDHATFAGAVAVALLFVSWRLGLLATLAALLMAFARVYVGVHWPRDVVAGLLLGGVVALIGALLTASILARLVTWAGGTRLRPLVLARPAERASSGASVAGTEQAAEPAPPARPSDAPHSTLAVGHSSLSNSVEEGRVPGQV